MSTSKSITQNNLFSKTFLMCCKGYNANFIHAKAKLSAQNILKSSFKKSLPKVEGNADGVLHYDHLSVFYNANRRVPFFTAYHVDGAKKKTVTRLKSFKKDPRIANNCMLDQKSFYDLRKDITEFEIGHMAANNEMAWGDTLEEAQQKADLTFFYTNTAPQAENLNGGVWKLLEQYVITEAANNRGSEKISVFTGPVLKRTDPAYKWDRSFQVPLKFFKVIIFSVAKQLYATAFMMSHEQKMIELGMIDRPTLTQKEKTQNIFEDFAYRKVYQVSVPFLQKETGLKFSWPGVKNIRIPKQRKLVQPVQNGMMLNAAADVSAKQIKEQNLTLNLVFPLKK